MLRMEIKRGDIKTGNVIPYPPFLNAKNRTIFEEYHGQKMEQDFDKASVRVCKQHHGRRKGLPRTLLDELRRERYR